MEEPQLLKPIGTLHYADHNGLLSRIGVAPTGQWRDIAEDLTKQADNLIDAPIIAVILRGCTARGMAVKGASDIDMLFVVPGQSKIAQDFVASLEPSLATAKAGLLTTISS